MGFPTQYEMGPSLNARVRDVETGTEFNTAKDAARWVLGSISSSEARYRAGLISKAAMHRGTSCGHTWELADGSSVPVEPRPRSTWGKSRGGAGSPVRCVETGEVFRSIRDAARSIHPKNVDSGAAMVSNAVRKGTRAGGLRWERVEV